MGKAHFPIIQLSQKTFVGLVFALVVVGGVGVRGQKAAGPKAFTTGETPNPTLCEKIKDTLGKSVMV
jgi:hypothetical protein